jgi:hypothetical protein
MLTRMNLHMQVFEEIFQSLDASNTPLFFMTPVVEGQLRFDAKEEIKVREQHNL